jgi:hypothetical protein
VQHAQQRLNIAWPSSLLWLLPPPPHGQRSVVFHQHTCAPYHVYPPTVPHYFSHFAPTTCTICTLPRRYPDGSVYTGSWGEGKKHGPGVYWDTRKGCLRGSWRKGTLVGTSVYDQPAIHYEGEFVAGVPAGGWGVARGASCWCRQGPNCVCRWVDGAGEREWSASEWSGCQLEAVAPDAVVGVAKQRPLAS